MGQITTFSEFIDHVRPLIAEGTDEVTLLLGILGEYGEVCDAIKKRRDRNAKNDTDILLELGDLLWYVTALAILKGEEGSLQRRTHTIPLSVPEEGVMFLGLRIIDTIHLLRRFYDGSKGRSTYAQSLRNQIYSFPVIIYQLADYFGCAPVDLWRLNAHKLNARLANKEGVFARRFA